jgi:hypothetical protein
LAGRVARTLTRVLNATQEEGRTCLVLENRRGTAQE